MSHIRNTKPDLCDVKQFQEFAEEPEPLSGDKVRIDAILNTPIIVTGADITQIRYSDNKSGKCLKLQFQRNPNEEKEIIFTGSDVLIEQIERYADKVPFQATIKKINRYYTFT